jgi:hypothetical protein
MESSVASSDVEKKKEEQRRIIRKTYPNEVEALNVLMTQKETLSEAAYEWWFQRLSHLLNKNKI